ncbi:MAG: discoidin domain-containing protein [Myxococcota bacterium]|nr:discoidin domain-containing protein [Myxococcota bacterium]
MQRISLCVLAVMLPGLAWGGATASAFKKETRKGANYWNAQAAIDGNPATAWMVPGESANRGEWILLELPKSEIDKIEILPGWGKSDSTFKDYARVKTLKVEVLCCLDSTPMEPVHTLELSVADENKLQVLDMEDVKLGNELFGGRIRLTVTDVYSGMDYPNMAVSEVLVHLKEFDVDSAVIEGVSGESESHPGDHLRDGSTRSFWAAPQEGASFTVGAEGFGLSSVGIQTGPRTHARPKKIRLVANNKELEFEMADKTGVQWFQVPALTGYTGSAWGAVEVQVVEVYPGSSSEDVAISEVQVKATNYEGI